MSYCRVEGTDGTKRGSAGDVRASPELALARGSFFGSSLAKIKKKKKKETSSGVEVGEGSD